MKGVLHHADHLRHKLHDAFLVMIIVTGFIDLVQNALEMLRELLKPITGGG